MLYHWVLDYVQMRRRSGTHMVNQSETFIPIQKAVRRLTAKFLEAANLGITTMPPRCQ